MQQTMCFQNWLHNHAASKSPGCSLKYSVSLSLYALVSHSHELRPDAICCDAAAFHFMRLISVQSIVLHPMTHDLMRACRELPHHCLLAGNTLIGACGTGRTPVAAIITLKNTPVKHTHDMTCAKTLKFADELYIVHRRGKDWRHPARVALSRFGSHERHSPARSAGLNWQLGLSLLLKMPEMFVQSRAEMALLRRKFENVGLGLTRCPTFVLALLGYAVKLCQCHGRRSYGRNSLHTALKLMNS